MDYFDTVMIAFGILHVRTASLSDLIDALGLSEARALAAIRAVADAGYVAINSDRVTVTDAGTAEGNRRIAAMP